MCSKKSVILFALFLLLIPGCRTATLNNNTDKIQNDIVVPNNQTTNNTAITNNQNIIENNTLPTQTTNVTDNTNNVITANKYKLPELYNLKINLQDTGVTNPANDRRCFYKIFLDKIEVGRTETALESQLKSYTVSVDVNRHLLSVEKWILDEANERYVKLNNIDQPKPNYIYFDLPSERIIVIDIVNDMNNRNAQYKIDFEFQGN